MVSVRRALSWWARDYAYAVYWQVRGSVFHGPAGRLATGTGRPVVMIPGVWEPWGFLHPLSSALHEAGHPVHVIPGLGRNSGSFADAAAIVAGVLDDLDLRDATIVAHSKGGLIGKYLMTHLDAASRVRAMVAICTPFAGSVYARYAGIRSLRSFAPDDPAMLLLQEELEVNAHITTISGVFDPHIPTVARLDGARNIVLDDGGHFRLLANPETIRTVLDVAR